MAVINFQFNVQGDSGGPLLFQEENDQKRWMIAGIVSWGRGCGDYTPGVYTNVRHYMDWIGKRILDAQIQDVLRMQENVSL